MVHRDRERKKEISRCYLAPTNDLSACKMIRSSEVVELTEGFNFISVLSILRPAGLASWYHRIQITPDHANLYLYWYSSAFWGILLFAVLKRVMRGSIPLSCLYGKYIATS